MNTPRLPIKMMLLSFLILISAACSSGNEIQERRNLMMPKLSDNPRNSSKFQERDYSKRQKSIDRELRKKKRKANRRNSR